MKKTSSSGKNVKETQNLLLVLYEIISKLSVLTNDLHDLKKEIDNLKTIIRDIVKKISKKALIWEKGKKTLLKQIQIIRQYFFRGELTTIKNILEQVNADPVLPNFQKKFVSYTSKENEY